MRKVGVIRDAIAVKFEDSVILAKTPSEDKKENEGGKKEGNK